MDEYFKEAWHKHKLFSLVQTSTREMSFMFSILIFYVNCFVLKIPGYFLRVDNDCGDSLPVVPEVDLLQIWV